MAQKIYRIVSAKKFELSSNSNETHVFKGSLEDILFKFGPKSTNPLVGYVSKQVHYVYKFYLWTGQSWALVDDPRPFKMEEYRVSKTKH